MSSSTTTNPSSVVSEADALTPGGDGLLLLLLLHKGEKVDTFELLGSKRSDGLCLGRVRTEGKLRPWFISPLSLSSRPLEGGGCALSSEERPGRYLWINQLLYGPDALSPTNHTTPSLSNVSWNSSIRQLLRRCLHC